MPSSERARGVGCVAAVVLAAATAFAPSAEAQQQPQGFAVERFYPSAPGGGWFVMDALDLHGGLGGAMSMTTGYARNPLRVTDGAQHLAVVSDQAFVAFGFAATYDRFRLYLDLDAPLAIQGTGGTVGGLHADGALARPGDEPRHPVGRPPRRRRPPLRGRRTVPSVWASARSSTCPRGTDATTTPTAPSARCSAGLVAGDVGLFTYAGQLGVHVRPLDDSPSPGSPRGSELLFGVAAGARLPVGIGQAVVVVGPEIYGETALRSALSTTATGVEGLLTGRLEGTADDGPQLRLKLGAGGGLDPHFGAPEWRVVLGVELFDHGGRRRFR